jgi:hypothetical protein
LHLLLQILWVLVYDEVAKRLLKVAKCWMSSPVDIVRNGKGKKVDLLLQTLDTTCTEVVD